MTDLPIEITFEVLRHFEQLGIDYMLVGSVASSSQGIARSTIDADVVADLKAEHLPSLLARLESDFYVSQSAAEDALRRRGVFNAIQFSSGFKVNIYVLGRGAFDQHEFTRRLRRESSGMALWVATPEDLILSKLHWYQLGQRVSERQWRDAAGLLQIHRPTMDYDYLRHWSRELGIAELWEKLQSH